MCKFNFHDFVFPRPFSAVIFIGEFPISTCICANSQCWWSKHLLDILPSKSFISLLHHSCRKPFSVAASVISDRRRGLKLNISTGNKVVCWNGKEWNKMHWFTAAVRILTVFIQLVKCIKFFFSGKNGFETNYRTVLLLRSISLGYELRRISGRILPMLVGGRVSTPAGFTVANYS